ncbi:MAG: DUF3108 domain-containing protein [Bacteroidales bacterium]
MRLSSILFITGLLLWCILISTGTTSAQCPTSNSAFGDGEQIRYTVSYNWGPVWVDAGLVTFSITSEPYRGKPAWHLKGTGKSFASYDLLFKVRDYFDSWIDPATFKTYDFRRNVFEGGYTLLNTLNFDHNLQKVIANTKTRNNPQRTDTLPVRPCAFDMLSAIYYTRTLDFSDLHPEIKQKVTVLLDDAYYDIYIRPMGKEVVESTDGKRYRCIKFAAKMVQGTIFKGEEDILVWVTDDANKIPIYIEAKIIVGTVKAYLKDAKGLRNAFSSVVK